MPARMLSFGEWAAEQGLETMAPGTWTAYTEYVSAFGEPETKEPYVSPTPPTVTVVNRSQQLRVAGLRPESAYSRIVSLVVTVKGDGIVRYMVTPVVGQSVRLLGVKAICNPKAINAAQSTGFGMYAGSTRPGSVADVQAWETVLPLYDNNNVLVEWGFRDGMTELEWEFNKLYLGEARRFAITYARGPAWGDDRLIVSFHVSEG